MSAVFAARYPGRCNAPANAPERTEAMLPATVTHGSRESRPEIDPDGNNHHPDTTACRYPGCKDPDGNPRLTRDGMCQVLGKNGRVRGCRSLFLRDFDRLVLDWAELHQRMPAPLAHAAVRTTRGSREYGHPAEWASDVAAHITGMLNWIHDDLAEALGADPPPHPGTSETVQVRAAVTFITGHFAQLCRQEWVTDTAIEIRELHNRIRARIGYTRPRIVLPTPCPKCEHLTLVRSIDYHRDQIDCGNCGHVIASDHYDFYTRILLGTLIGADKSQPSDETVLR